MSEIQSHSPTMWPPTFKTYLVYILPSYLKDTTDFLNMLKHWHVNSNDLLCTVDMSSTYPSVAHKNALDAMHYFLNQRVESHHLS